MHAKSRVQPLALLLWLFLTSLANAQSAEVLQQTRQLLDWLGFMALLEQAPQVLNDSVEAEAQFRQAGSPQLAAWRRELEPKLKPQQLQQELVRYVAERYRADTFQQAEQLLQQPLPKRVRYFDLAMAQPAAVKGLREFRAQQADSTSARRALAQELDAATATSTAVAALQTGISEKVRRLAGNNSSDKQLLLAETAERQRFLAQYTEDYFLYAYRYLNDDELAAYRDLMRAPPLQWVLDVGRQGVTAVLDGTR